MQPCKVLIVDDDQDDVEILVEAFARHGIKEVHTVPSAAGAIQFLNQVSEPAHLPRLIITDLYLPVKSGIELIDDLARNADYSKIPVVLLSNLRLDMAHNVSHLVSDSNYFKKPSSYNGYLEIANQLQRIVA